MKKIASKVGFNLIWDLMGWALIPWAAGIMLLIMLHPAPAQQFVPGMSVTVLGQCQIATAGLNSQVNLSACIGASFTGTCSGNVITASSVTGNIVAGWPLSGTGITSGTYVASVAAGTTGGAGTYVASQACTSSSNSLTTVGPPNGANIVLLKAETQNVRWRDDGGAPTTTVGMLMATGDAPFLYNGNVSALRVISATAGAALDAAFYRTSSP